MPTPYSNLFNSFLSKIEDDLYAQYTKEQLDSDLIDLLNSAIINFEYPKVDIYNKNDETQEFIEDLSIFEIEILANLMTLEWIKRQIKSIYVIKQAMTDSDFRITSQANHLKMLLELKKVTESDIDKLQNKYSYRTSNHQANFEGLAGD